MTAQANTYEITFANTPYLDTLTKKGSYSVYETKINEDPISGLGKKSDGAMDPITASYSSTEYTPLPVCTFSVVGYRLKTWAAHYPGDEDEDDPEEVKPLSNNNYTGNAEFGTMQVKFPSTFYLPDYNLLPLESIWYKSTSYSVYFSANKNDAYSTFRSTDASLKRDNYAWDSASVVPVGDLDFANVNASTYVGKLSDEDRAKLEWWTQPGGQGYQFTTAVPFYTLATEDGAIDPLVADGALLNNQGKLVLYPYDPNETPTPTTCTVTYHADGADSGTAPTDANSPYDKGDTVTVLGNTGNLAKADYTFKGWSTSSSATTLTYDMTGATAPTFTINGDVDLYPYFEEDVTYTITYSNTPYSDSLSGTEYTQAITEDATTHLGAKSGTMADTTDVPTGSWSVVSDNTFAVVGYRFKEWGMQKDAKVQVIPAANKQGSVDAGTFKVKFAKDELSDPENKVLTLEGIWEKHDGYQVVFSEYYASATSTFASDDPTLVRDEYQWDSSVPFIDAKDFAEVGTTSDVGKLSAADQAKLQWWTQPGGKGYRFTAATPFYVLATGKAAPTSDEAVSADAALAAAGDVLVLYPYMPQVEIKYYGNRSEADNASPIAALTQKADWDTDTTVVQDPADASLTRTGYTFAGWSTNKDESASNPAQLLLKKGTANEKVTVAQADVSLYAIWAANKYTVSVYGDHKDTATATQTISAQAYDSEFSITRPNARPGYEFGGWATASGVTSATDSSVIAPSSGSVAGNDEKYKNLTATDGATVNVYSVWIPNPDVVVTLSNADPATGATSTTTKSYPSGSAEASLSAPAAVEGYVFAGWYENAADPFGNLYGTRAGTSKTDASLSYDGTMDGTVIAGCVTTWPTTTTTVYAKWVELDGYSVTYVNASTHKNASGKPAATETRSKDANGDDIKWTSTGIVPTDLAVGGTASDGYTFKGWFKQGDLNADGTLKDGVSPNDAVAATAAYKGIATKLGLTDDKSTTPRLFAGWEAGQVDVVFDNGAFTAAGNARTPKTGAGDASYTVKVTVGTTPTMTCDFTLDGYEFKYWKYDDGASVKYFDENGVEVDANGTAVAGGATYKAGATGSAGNTLTAQWKPIEYNVKFQDGSGNTSATVLKVKYDGYASATLPDGATLFTKAGCTFANWKDVANNKEYDGGAALTGNLRTTAGDAILQAQWTANVTFRFTEGLGTLEPDANMPADVVRASGGTWDKKDVPDVPAALIYEGYDSDGWTDGKTDYKREASGTYDVPVVSAPTTVVLYPNWTPKSASVKLHYNDGGTTPDATISVDKDGVALVTDGIVSLPAAPTKANYTFVGWSVKDDGSIDTLDGDVLASATEYTAPAGNPSHLYAVWSAGGVTVTFSANATDATGTMAAQTNLTVDAETGTLNANAFARDGYTFAGWVLKGNAATKLDANGCLVDGQAVDYVDKQTFDSTKKVPAPASGDTSVDLLAAWVADDVVITFDGNGGTTTAASTTQTVKASDSPVTLQGPTFTRTGYTFDGWSKSKSRTAYVDGTDWKNNDDTTKYTLDLSGATDANKLYAIWKPAGVTYTIERYQEKLDGTWEKVSDSTTAPLVGVQSGTTGDAVSIAGDVSVYDGFTLDSTVSNATVPGEANPVSTNLSGTVAADGSTVLRAFYKRNVHSVTYKLDPAGQATPSGFTMPTNLASVKYGADKVGTASDEVNLAVAAKPTATGWTFSVDGWTGSYTDSEGTHDLKSGDAFTMPDADVVLTGAWTQMLCTVTFDGNGGTVTGAPSPDIEVPSGQKMDSMQATAAKGVAFTLSGKYAASWEKSVDNGSTWTACNDPWDETIADDTVFRPVWADTFAVVYKPGIGGDFADDTHEGLDPVTAGKDKFPAFAGSTETVQGQTAPKAKAGFTFDNWKVTGSSVNAEIGKTYTAAEIATKTANVIDGNYTLEAQWTRTGQKLNLDFGGGAVSAASVVVAADGSAPEADVAVDVGDTTFAEATVGTGLTVTLPAVEKAGYTFAGWTVTTDEANALTAPVGAKAVFDMPAGAVTLTAAWTEDPAANATMTYRTANSDMGLVSVTEQVIDAATGDVVSQTPPPGTGETMVLGSVPVAKHGYKFKEWKRVGGTALMGAVDATTKALTPTAGSSGFEDRTYEASFEKAKYEVQFSPVALMPRIPAGCALDVTELTADDLSVEYLGSIPLGKAKAAADTNGSYKFAGWLYETDDDGDPATAAKANDFTTLLADPGELDIEGDTKFWPAFVPAKTNVTYNLNDPAASDVDANTTFAEKADISTDYLLKKFDDMFTKPAGYTFLGWATSASATTPEYTYDADAGTFNPASMAADDLAAADGGVTFYAVWDADSVGVVYKPGNHATAGTQEYSDDAHKAGEANVAVLKNDDASVRILPADGYAFAGWQGSDGVVYLDGSASEVTSIAKLPGEGMTMTALWKYADSNIIYNGNGGKTGNGEDEITIPSAALLDIIVWTKGTVETGDSGKPMFAREGYSFETWNTSPAGTSDEYVPGSRATMPASNGLTLYAQWAGLGATLTLDAGSGLFSGDRTTLTYSGLTDDEVTLEVPSTTLLGVKFAGWSRTEGATEPDEDLVDDGTGASLTATLGRLGEDGAYEAASTLYGVWQPLTAPEADKSALLAAIAAAKAAEEGVKVSEDGSDVDPSDMWTTADAKDAFDAVIAAVQAVADDPDATQDEVDQAAIVMGVSTAAFEKIKQPGTKAEQQVDTKALDDAIAAAEAAEKGVKVSKDGSDVDPSDKWTTAAEKKALDDAIAAAKAVAADPDATQEDVDAAVAAVNAAKAAYEAAEKAGTKSDEPAPVEPVVVMYRLYNPNSGEHHYTADKAERDNVVAAGWNDEGVGWVAPVKSATPVYRLYNSHEPLGDHHYTTDKAEYDNCVAAGWTGEGIGWYSDDSKRMTLHRVYNPNAYAMGMTGAHHYTADKPEADYLASIGWRAEGIAWYGVAASPDKLPAGVKIVTPEDAARILASGTDLVAASL